GDAPGVFRRLALRVVEVGRHGDDRLGDFLPEVVFGGFLELLEDLGAHFGRRNVLAANVESAVSIARTDDFVGDAPRLLPDLLEASANEAFGAKNRVFRVRDRLTFGDLPNQDLTLFVPGDHARRDPRPLFIDDNLGLAALHDRNDAVGRTQVDADD